MSRATAGGRRTAAWTLAFVITVVGCSPPAPASDRLSDGATRAPTPARAIPTPVGRSPVAVAVGDLVCAAGVPAPESCQHASVATLVDTLAPDVLLLLGDLQYEAGALSTFRNWFEPAFGRFKPIMRPVPGNHEYVTRGASGYFDYFNGVDQDVGMAGARNRGYYSFDIGSWHLIALNSNCAYVGGCGAGSAQEQWLRADLAANRATCTLAYWHHPRFSSGNHGNEPAMTAVWRALQDAGADVVLAAHDHVYERFAAQRADGTADERAGIREFVVGTGGRSMYAFPLIRANSEVRHNDAFGALRLSLDSAGYSWRFVEAPSGVVLDEGSGRCHAPPAPMPPA